MSPRRLLLAVLLIWIPFTAATRAQSDQDIVFATVDGQRLALDLYRPAGDTAPVGVIVWVHGGAWRAGSRDSVELKGMTAHGWAVASVDYRLSPVAPFPAQAHDIKAAIRYLRAHATELDIPATPFVVAGSSAGGHLAALIGTSNHQAELEGNVGEDIGTDSSVQAAVVLFGASNLTTILKQSTPHGLNVRVPALELFIGGHPDDVPATAKLASPIYHVDAGDPPIYLSHGDQDPQMPINQTHELHGAYQALGLPVHFEVKHGSAHGGPAFTNAEELARIDGFLRAHLFR